MLPIISLDSSLTSHRALGTEMDRPKGRRGHKVATDRFTCSQQSILMAMDRFVKCVNNMDSTVLVPSKLQDMETAGLKCASRVPSALSNADLHSFYTMLNNVKKELLWGPGTVPQTSHGYVMRNSAALAIDRSSSSRSVASSGELKRELCSRQSSDDSLGSLGSTASSSASDTDSDVDSFMTDRDSIDDHTAHLSAAFRHHLQGLHSILHQLADSADFLCLRYQEEVDSGL